MLQLLKQKGKYLAVTGLAAATALTAIENEIPDVSNLVKKKKDYDAKILDIESKYFTTADYNKRTRQKLDAKMKKRLVDKFDIVGFINNADLGIKSRNISNKSRTKQNNKITSI